MRVNQKKSKQWKWKKKTYISIGKTLGALFYITIVAILRAALQVYWMQHKLEKGMKAHQSKWQGRIIKIRMIYPKTHKVSTLLYFTITGLYRKVNQNDKDGECSANKSWNNHNIKFETMLRKAGESIDRN